MAEFLLLLSHQHGITSALQSEFNKQKLWWLCIIKPSLSVLKLLHSANSTESLL